MWTNLIQHFCESLLANDKFCFQFFVPRHGGDSDDADNRAGDDDDGDGDAGADDGKHRQQRCCTRHLGTGSSGDPGTGSGDLGAGPGAATSQARKLSYIFASFR